MTPAGLHLALQILVADLLNGGDDPLSLEERTLDILKQVLAQRGCNDPTSPSSDARTQKRLADMLEYLSAKRCEHIKLDDVGRVAGCSSWHAARVFRKQMGLPIHRYLKRLRLRHALAAVAQGSDDLTQLALQCGFSSHSHMTAAFRTEFSVVPRAIRQRCVQNSSPCGASIASTPISDSGRHVEGSKGEVLYRELRRETTCRLTLGRRGIFRSS